jgi:hypothetical protein
MRFSFPLFCFLGECVEMSVVNFELLDLPFLASSAFTLPDAMSTFKGNAKLRKLWLNHVGLADGHN